MDSKKFQTFCDCFYEATQKVVTVIPGFETFIDGQSQVNGKIYTAIVGVVGFNKGRVQVEMNEGLASIIYECVNGEKALDEKDLCYYLAEFTNMVAGNGITILNKLYKGINLRLTPPAIFAGDDLEIWISPKVMAAERFLNTPFGMIRILIGFEGQ